MAATGDNESSPTLVDMTVEVEGSMVGDIGRGFIIFSFEVEVVSVSSSEESMIGALGVDRAVSEAGNDDVD